MFNQPTFGLGQSGSMPFSPPMGNRWSGSFPMGRALPPKPNPLARALPVQQNKADIGGIQQAMAKRGSCGEPHSPMKRSPAGESGLKYKVDKDADSKGEEAFKSLDNYMKKAGLNSFQANFFNHLIQKGFDGSGIRMAVKQAEAQFGNVVSKELRQGLQKLGFSQAPVRGPGLLESISNKMALSPIADSAANVGKRLFTEQNSSSSNPFPFLGSGIGRTIQNAQHVAAPFMGKNLGGGGTSSDNNWLQSLLGSFGGNQFGQYWKDNQHWLMPALLGAAGLGGGYLLGGNTGAALGGVSLPLLYAMYNQYNANNQQQAPPAPPQQPPASPPPTQQSQANVIPEEVKRQKNEYAAQLSQVSRPEFDKYEAEQAAAAAAPPPAQRPPVAPPPAAPMTQRPPVAPPPAAPMTQRPPVAPPPAAPMPQQPPAQAQSFAPKADRAMLQEIIRQQNQRLARPEAEQIAAQTRP